jgi:hypothetical protein
MDLPRVDANAFGAQVGTGLMRLGQALGARAEEQQRESRNQQRMAQLTRWVELRAETAKDRQDARANVAPDAADHQKKVLERFDARASAFMGGISDPELQAEYQARIAEARADLDLDEGAYVVGVRADKAARDADTAISTAANELYNIGTERGLQQQLTLFDQTFAAIPELNVEQRAKLTGYARNRLTRSYIEGLAERDPYAARDVLRSGKLNAFIDADNMTAIGNRVDAEIRGREAAQKAAAAAARQEARAAATLQLAAAREQRDQEIEWADGIVAVAEKNVPIPMQVMKQAAAVYARHGNPGKAISAEVIGTRNAVNLQFGNKNPVLLQREEQRLSAEIAQAGAKADPALIAARDQLRILRKTQRENAATDLLGWEARYGATIPDLDGSNPESFAERGRIARDAARRYGVPPQVLTSTEADAYAERLTNGTAQQKLQMARELSLFGAMASAAAKQVAARDPVAGWAVGLAGQGRFAAAQDLFAGADVVKGNPKIAPTANVDARFADTVGGAFRYMPPAALNTLKAAATNIYAARWGREGGSEWRPEAFDAGVRMALGGVKGSDGIERGGLGEWRGSPVALPAGVSQADFERSMALLSTEKLKASGVLRPVGDRGQDIPAETVRRGELLPVGDGLYYVQLPGASAPLNAANGKPFVLRIGRPER